MATGAIVSMIGLRPPAEHRCDWPTNAERLQGMAGADPVRDRTGGARHAALVWLEGFWLSADASGARSSAQLMITSSLSDFMVQPLWMFPVFELETDETRPTSLEGRLGPVPATLRINRIPEAPFVEGWITAFEDRPVDDPVRYLLRRAFRHPLSPAPPITMIGAVHEAGRSPIDQRIRVVSKRLETLWRDWESSCRS